MKPCIIGIAGKANSGKDTIASMINYIVTVGLSQAKYADWITKRISNDKLHGNRIIHFADKLKDVVSIMFSIPRHHLDDRKYKDELYWSLTSKCFIDYNLLSSTAKTHTYIIDIKDLNKFTLKEVIDNVKNYDNVFIKVRTLLQYIGNNIGRDIISENIWIDSTIKNAINIASCEHVCIISDIRYENEANAIFNNALLYGGLIKIIRDKNTEVTDSNIESEKINFKTDYIVYNKSTLANTFYQVLNICQQINELNN